MSKTYHRALLLLLAPLSVAVCSEPDGGGDPGPEPRVVGTAPAQLLGGGTVVTLTPEGMASQPTPIDTALIDQVALEFVPDVLIVRKSQTVEFRNSEASDHNVIVRSLRTDSVLFNVGSVRGDPFYFSFEQEGVYGAECNIHSNMSATIYVVSTPWAVPVKRDGTFAFMDVPQGSYEMALWSRDPDTRSEQTVVLGVTGADTVEIRVR